MNEIWDFFSEAYEFTWDYIDEHSLYVLIGLIVLNIIFLLLWHFTKNSYIDNYDDFIKKLEGFLGKKITKIIKVPLLVVRNFIFYFLIAPIFIFLLVSLTKWTWDNIDSLGWWRPEMFAFIFVVCSWGGIIYGVCAAIRACLQWLLDTVSDIFNK